MFEKLKKRLILWSLKSNYEDLAASVIASILSDDLYSRVRRKIFGTENWICFVCDTITIAEDYLYKIEQLGGKVKHYDDRCPICGSPMEA